MDIKIHYERKREECIFCLFLGVKELLKERLAFHNAISASPTIYHTSYLILYPLTNLAAYKFPFIHLSYLYSYPLTENSHSLNSSLANSTKASFS